MSSRASPRAEGQFESVEHRRAVATMGMWIFLVTEVLFFGGAFTVYAAYRTTHPEGFAEGSRHMNVVLGGINTAVLLVSSLLMALAVRAAATGARRPLVLFLLATIALGAVFLGVKGYEYVHHAAEGLLPGPSFAADGPRAETVNLFMSFYFLMTGMHALHMVIGIGVLSVLALLAARGRYSERYHSPVEMAGLYWHFVDVVWIFLYPLLYLIGRAS